MLKTCAAIFFIALCGDGAALVFTPVLSGKQDEAGRQVNKAIEKANHCNADADCGSVNFECRGQYYNRHEATIGDLVDNYNSNKKFKHKCSGEDPAGAALCRDNKCVPG